LIDGPLQYSSNRKAGKPAFQSQLNTTTENHLVFTEIVNKNQLVNAENSTVNQARKQQCQPHSLAFPVGSKPENTKKGPAESNS